MMNIHAMRRVLRAIAFAAASSVALSACAAMGSQASPVKLADGAMTTPAGKTLYTFDRDTAGSGKSVCNGPCIDLWPAFNAPAHASAAGDWSVATRDDGTRQWAYKGKPLYTFSRDAKPGDRTGDGFNKVWHLARP